MHILPNSTHTTDKFMYSVNIYIYQITAETYQYNTICKYNEQTTTTQEYEPMRTSEFAGVSDDVKTQIWKSICHKQKNKIKRTLLDSSTFS